MFSGGGRFGGVFLGGFPGMSFGECSGNVILDVSCQDCQFPVIESASVYEVFLFFYNSKLC